MNFRPQADSEPEINLIPFIDVLLVILIFLMLTTTYSRFNELQLTLPLANAEQLSERPQEITVAIDAGGQYAIDGQLLGKATPSQLTAELRQFASSRPEAILIISADAMASHQSVISVMEAARNAGLVRVTFATQAASGD
ncbi:biopolymer transporter ExbD [Corticibacter populi]|uniref:Biopolymer transporter ExbD n=1 Tax=Corticibacter populi TaxID=1550736 RepID=A0A3M6QJC5_9BURK|nr:biopolymer transporter ExbD [Corticibacter populi]RMX02592.1 biopolymer transporter ExbD [Corticibacter populi]RZS32995.1 biopolymer transport protein ExbD [Corticibacter populi]